MNPTLYCSILLISSAAALSRLPPADPCGHREYQGKTCEEGKVCRLVLDATCPTCPPQPKCVDEPTAVGNCSDFLGDPVVDGNNTPVQCSGGTICPSKTVCNKGNPPVCCWEKEETTSAVCAAVTCPVGTVCVARVNQVSCLGLSCPPKYDCVKTTSAVCAAVTCPVGTVCVARVNQVSCLGLSCPPKYDCVKRSQCNPSCPAGKECRIKLDCGSSPCGTKYVCLPKVNPDILNRCPSGSGGPLVDSTNADVYCGRGGTKCPNGFTCVIEKGDKYAVCCKNTAVEKPCSLMLCKEGYICVDEVSCDKSICELKGKCVRKQCTKVCGNTEECRFQQVTCIRSPCPPTQICLRKASPATTKLCPAGSGGPVLSANNINIRCTTASNCPDSTVCVKGKVCCKAPADKIGQCPQLEPTTIGICVEKCSSDQACEGDQKCCSNGCGHVCTIPCKNCKKWEKCVVKPVQCIKAPCPAAVACVPKNKERTCSKFPNKRCRRRYSRLQRCNGDSDCNAKRLCCKVGRCGKRCVRPRK